MRVSQRKRPPVFVHVESRRLHAARAARPSECGAGTEVNLDQTAVGRVA
jgi:hypothetical protein